jgi:SAM-dependent methyltransferase
VLDVVEQASTGMVATGTLRAPSGREYPIVGGVPRFVPAESYASSFGYQWNRWPRVQFDSENEGGPMRGHTRRMWEATTGVGDDQVRGRTIVEFGCGSGRFLDVVRRKGGRAVGIDLSAAVDAARRNFANDPDVLIVQGDVLRPPFREDAFDGGYSIGVLHHTPDPAGGLRALARLVHPGGWVACCVYPKGEFYDFRSVARLRRLSNRLAPFFGRRPALWYAYFSAFVLAPLMGIAARIPGVRRIVSYLARNWLVWIPIPDARWRFLDTFDAITPAIASTHTGAELRSWFLDAGCDEVRATPWCATSGVGVRR